MITNIRLQNFRSYSDESFEFESGVNIVVGPNASGKTNLLEAIMCAAIGSTYRGRDVDLVMHDQNWARIDVEDKSSNQRTIKLQNTDGKVKKQVEINDTKTVRMPAARRIPFVLFEPNHLLMFHGGPELRRDFIDTLLDQLSPEFLIARKQYKRALMQRNSLLKNMYAGKDELFVWNLRLSDLGGVIAAERNRLISELNKQIPKIYQNLSGNKVKIRVDYKSDCREKSYASDLLTRLEKSLEYDKLRGYTTVGPHRDDIEVFLNDHYVKEAASRGEVRTIVLAFKIFEQLQLEQKTGQKPLLLLDDVFSELDGARRRHLTEYLKDHQVFITTTDADVVVKHFTGNSNVIALSG